MRACVLYYNRKKMQIRGKEMKRARLASLDAVRAFACLAVLAYHMHLVGFGHISLALFFMLGGFLSAYNSYGRSDTQNVTLKSCVGYSRDKIMKLYPLHIAALLIPLAGQIYGAVHKLISAKLVAFKLAANLVLLQSWIPLNDIYFSLNAPAWYLSTIAFSYFMFPWLLKGLEKLRSARLVRRRLRDLACANRDWLCRRGALCARGAPRLDYRKELYRLVYVHFPRVQVRRFRRGRVFGVRVHKAAGQGRLVPCVDGGGACGNRALGFDRAWL